MLQDELESVERALTNILLTWGIASTTAGSAIAVRGSRSQRPQLMRFGRQTAMWGAIDGLIAGAGIRSRRGRGELSPQQVEVKARNLRRLLMVNAVADIGYVIGGAVIAGRGLTGRSTFRMSGGDGVAIVIQGGFLLVLDSYFAKRVAQARGMS